MLPVEGSYPSSGRSAFFLTLYARCKNGGNVYVNCRIQAAETTAVNPEKSGIAAPTTKAIDQYTGMIATQAHLPLDCVRGGARKNSTAILL